MDFSSRGAFVQEDAEAKRRAEEGAEEDAEEDEGGSSCSGAKFDALAGATSERTAGTDLKATVGAISETTVGVIPEAFSCSLAGAREEISSLSLEPI